jgi:peptidoglycan/xylan/chitin deacetylase (PgdA/CDA1 family)
VPHDRSGRTTGSGLPDFHVSQHRAGAERPAPLAQPVRQPGAFARQMWLLKRLGYTGLSMSDAMPYLRGEREGRIAVVTLDDGYVDNLESAMPVLQRYGFTATCYVVSGSIGRFNNWDAEKLGIEKPLMSPAQLRAWHDGGMEIGAHTRSHPRLTQCNDAQLHDEIAGSKADLEDHLGAAVTQFCYPYGDMNDRVADVTREAGYDAATTTHRGRAVIGTICGACRACRSRDTTCCRSSPCAL